MAQLNFDASSVDPTNPFETLPADEYLSMVTESEVKETKAGNGYYLELTLEVLDGQYKGRRIWDRINIQNQNKTAEDIGRRQLSQLCHAVGLLHVADSAELHDKPFIAKIAVEKDKSGQYDDKNVVKAYKPVGAAATASSSAPAAKTEPAVESADDTTPPWLRK